MNTFTPDRGRNREPLFFLGGKGLEKVSPFNEWIGCQCPVEWGKSDMGSGGTTALSMPPGKLIEGSVFRRRIRERGFFNIVALKGDLK